jgi:hypothetical protein
VRRAALRGPLGAAGRRRAVRPQPAHRPRGRAGDARRVAADAAQARATGRT